MKTHVRPDANQMAEELALLGHDIRTAVTDVMAGLALIDDQRLGIADRLQLDRAKATTESLARYLEEGLTTLLAQAPPELAATPIDLGRLLKDLKRRWCYCATSTQSVAITATDLPAMVLCNLTALDRILSNLISNAIAYSGGQMIHVRIIHPAPDQLCFSVTDQGPGFPPHLCTKPDTGSPHISALPAWQSRQGHGLGLSIAQSLARRIGATLVLRNHADGGGVATLCMPVSRIDDVKSAPALDVSSLQGKTVLVADDSMPQLLLLAQFLRDSGAQITMVRDGISAEAAITAGDFDLALIDLEMPGRTGIEICEAFRDRPNPTGKTTRIVILTAHHLPMVHQNALAAGAAQVLIKPITSSQALAEALCGDHPQALHAPAAPPRNNAAEFTRLLDMAGPEMATELLARYQEDLTAVQTKLTAALPGLDWQSLRDASHVLIALAGTAGMARLEHTTRDFNLAANDTNRNALLSQKDSVLDGLADLLRFVHNIAQERQG